MGTDEDVIIEALKNINLKKWETLYFTNLKEVKKFIDENEPIERKQLIEKYKDTNILEVPLKDLKKMGIEVLIC